MEYKEINDKIYRVSHLSSLASIINYKHRSEMLPEMIANDIEEFKKEFIEFNDEEYTYEELEELLNNLYKMHYLKDETIEALVNKYNYKEKKLIELKQIIAKKQNFINGEYSYTTDEYQKMLESIQDDRIDQNINYQFADICIKAILEQKYTYNVDEIVEIFNKKIESITSKISNRKIKLCSIYGYEDDHHGAVYSSIELNTDIKYDRNPNIYVNNKLFAEDPLIALITSYHEMIHQLQYDSLIQNQQITSSNFLNITDIISRFSIGKEYYNQNYLLIYEELEAYIVSHETVKDMIKSNNISISKYQMKYIDETIDYYKQFYNNQAYLYRRCDNKIISCKELLDQQLANNPKYFDFFSQLSMLYKKENGNVIAKSKEELIDDYLNYSTGKLQLNGNSNEIENIYLSHIKAFSVVEKQKEKAVIQAVEQMEQGLNVIEVKETEKEFTKQMGYTIIGVLSTIAFLISIGIIYSLLFLR